MSVTKVISVTQLKLLREFKSDSERRLWLREQGFELFGRVTVDKTRHYLWFNPELIRKDRVLAHFKKEIRK